ncbi:MAG TPA: hypothetical protein VFW96_27165 [Thermomicrobiales bacterium]|nr:hypothetical protein [Thermomicrobiales bacterium]
MGQPRGGRAGAGEPGGAGEWAPIRLTVRRVRLRALAGTGLVVGLAASVLPAILLGALGVALARRFWLTLDAWTPWRPWPADERIMGIRLPNIEYRPREALHVEGVYRQLAPVAHHPFASALLLTLALIALGGLLGACALWVGGLAYNRLARVTGGIQLEATAPRDARAARRQRLAGREEARDDIELRWE